MGLVDQIARLLTSPLADGLLIGLGVAGILIEMQSLLGAGIAVALAAFATFFGAHVALGDVGAGFAALAAAGLVGIALELHVASGHGVAGIAGIVALAIGVTAAIGPLGAFVCAQTVVVALVVAALAFGASTRAFPRNAFAHRFTFRDMQGSEYVAGVDRHAYLGRAGVAASPLRPAGIVTFDGERLDASSDGAFVAPGSAVHVTRVEGGRLFVTADAVPAR